MTHPVLADLFRLDPRLAPKIEAVREDDCWFWNGATVRSRRFRPYGVLKRKGKFWLAHRFVHTLIYGPIPEGFEVHHTCRETLCVNPRHIVEALHPDEHAWRQREVEMSR